MAIASLVLGILALCFSFIPCVGMYAVVPGGLGTLLGLIALIGAFKNKKPKGIAIVGTLLCAASIVVGVANFHATDEAVKELDKAGDEAIKELDKAGHEAIKGLDEAVQQSSEI